ncbi:polysaccharide deacetylase family protein [Anaeromicrobium sediminis]|uniref:NodB homology domain-containing protein n=1 Tax=Anaeromicrobium sediminis TaxID=1478221 RepID=A0A267MIR1_9FIRM|nr:polysaccharide deacetylase family protein [Anaeromicrobium sediminis]PAB59471.1 hypothetical protein CCE28_09650 [Anaeromicrobium sediminis]
MKPMKKMIFLILLPILIFAACGTNDMKAEVKDEKIDNSAVEEKMEVENTEEKVVEKKEIDLQKIKPNELGQVMVLMYHSVSEPEAEFTRTPDGLRKDLEYMYENGYRPVSLKDYATGNISVEAGFTPIVLTFDDGWENNFSIIEKENGEFEIDPNCAVAILEEFNKEHPDFPLEVTFFVNDNIPFGQDKYLEYKLNYIVEKGMDIGNHTATHVNFTKADPERIQKEIVGIVKLVKKYVPDYEVNTMALPFGSRPKNKELYKYLEKGEYDGVKYENIAILNVGWDPYKSPYHSKFNSLAIHRVRASDLQKYVDGVGMYDWFKHFEKGNRTRYISDGDKDIITIPKNYEDVLDKSKITDKEIRTYELNKENK